MQQEAARVYQGAPPSAVRGWFKHLGGLLTFNRRRIYEGKNEVNDARVYRQYERDRRRGHRSHSRQRTRGAYQRDEGHRSERHHPFLHYPYRCRPTYHGAHFRLWGFLTRKKEHIARGIQMREEAERERQRERRRRLKRLQAEGLAIRLGAREVTPRDHSRGHRSHHHRDRRHGFTPIVTTANVGHGVSVPVAATTHVIPVSRSASARTHHRHHSSGHSTTAPLVHVHSRSHSGPATPIVQVAHSQYTNAAPVAVSHAASSRHGHANEYYDDRVIPVARSSSRHGSSRYGDPALSRVSSSRHGHGHYRHARTHSRTPSEVYVAA